MNDDDYIMLDARIDGLREAIAAIVSSLNDNSPAVAALQALQSRMLREPTHSAATEQVIQLVELVERKPSSGETVEGNGCRHGEAAPA